MHELRELALNLQRRLHGDHLRRGAGRQGKDLGAHAAECSLDSAGDLGAGKQLKPHLGVFHFGGISLRLGQSRAFRIEIEIAATSCGLKLDRVKGLDVLGERRAFGGH